MYSFKHDAIIITMILFVILYLATQGKHNLFIYNKLSFKYITVNESKMCFNLFRTHKIQN